MNALSNIVKTKPEAQKPEACRKESESWNEQNAEKGSIRASCACGGGCKRCNTNPEKIPSRHNALPDPMRNAMEHMSGMDLSSVNVHYNSREPSQLGANAYAKSNDIHLAPGHENELPHEAWHVVQQMQGRVQADGIRNGIPTNLDKDLESEADSMGEKSTTHGFSSTTSQTHIAARLPSTGGARVTQLSPTNIVTVEVYPKTGEVVITLENGKKYTYPLNTTGMMEPVAVDSSITPEYESGTKIAANHQAQNTTDHHRQAQKYNYNWSFNSVSGQPDMKDFPPGSYNVIYYLKGAENTGTGKGQGEGSGDKQGEGETSEKKDTPPPTEGTGDKKADPQEVTDFIAKTGDTNTDGTPLTEAEKKRIADALSGMSEAQKEQFLKVKEQLGQKCDSENTCPNKSLAELLEFYKKLDEPSLEALSINQMLQTDPTTDSEELPEEILLDLKHDAGSTADAVGKTKEINSNLALIQSKITDPALKKDLEQIDLSKLSELNTMIMIQGLLAGASERLPEIQPVAVELTTNIGKIRDFIVEEISWLLAEIAATALFSFLTAPVSGGTSLAAGAAAAGHIAIKLNKLRKVIQKIQNLIEVVNKIQSVIATFQTVKSALDKSDFLLTKFEETRARVQKFQDLLKKGEATAEQITQMEDMEDELLELLLGSDTKAGMMDKLEPVMDKFFLPDDLTDDQLKQIIFDIPNGIKAMEEMLAYKRAVEGGNADQSVTLSLKGFQAGYLLAPFVGFLTEVINDKLGEIMAEQSISERIIGFGGGKRHKGGGLKGSKTKPQQRLKKVKKNKDKRAEAQKKTDATAAADAKAKAKDPDKDKDKTDKPALTGIDDSDAKWTKMKAEIQAIGGEAKEQGGMTQMDVKKKASQIVNKAEYKIFDAKISLDDNSGDPALNRLRVEDRGAKKIPASSGTGTPKKRRIQNDILVSYLRPEVERYKSLNSAIKETFKAWPEDKSDTKDAIEAKLLELKKANAYPLHFKYPDAKVKEKGKAEVEKEEVSGDIIAWKIMTSLRTGALGEVTRVLRPGNYWGSNNNPIPLDWNKPAITNAAHYEPVYVGPYVAGETRVTQKELKDNKDSSLPDRQKLADSIEARVANADTKAKIKKWRDTAVIEKYEATGGVRALPKPSMTSIGVIPKWQVKTGEKFPFSPQPRDGAAGKTFTGKIALFGFSAQDEGKDGDHIWEIQVGGPDNVENMWPLESSLNQSAGGELERATIKTPDNKSVSMKKLKEEARTNIGGGKEMWIKIKSTK
ncbi:MAG: DUF4157 domain-containing protein [Arenimonas sp.]